MPLYVQTKDRICFIAVGSPIVVGASGDLPSAGVGSEVAALRSPSGAGCDAGTKRPAIRRRYEESHEGAHNHRRTRFNARLTAVGFAAIVASASVVACTGSPPPAQPKLSPGVTTSASPGISPSPTATVRTPSMSPSTTPRAGARPSATRSAGARPSATRTPSAGPFPTAAPATGGGGTAGFQGAWLLGLGGVAILAGAGCVAYRTRRIGNR